MRSGAYSLRATAPTGLADGSIEVAIQCAWCLDRRGERVSIYHSHLAPTIRRRNLELFKLGHVSTLVTCRALDEGLNVPDASVAIIAASTRSTRQRIQRLRGECRRHLGGREQASVALWRNRDKDPQCRVCCWHFAGWCSGE